MTNYLIYSFLFPDEIPKSMWITIAPFIDGLIDCIVFRSAQEYLRPYRDETVVSDESMLSTYDVLAVRDLNRVANAATPTFLLWGLIRRTAQISRLYDKSGIPRSSSYPFSVGLATCKLNNTTTSFQTWKNDKKRTLKCFHSDRKQKIVRRYQYLFSVRS